MRTYAQTFIKLLAMCLLVAMAHTVTADPKALSGTWKLNEDESGTLKDEINELKQEHRDWTLEHGKINDEGKPDPFESKRKFGEKEWESRRGGPVANASVKVRQMVSAESLKLYVSDRIVVAYDGKVKRLLNPNPIGRVHSATGKGISKDAIGETLAYIEDDAVVIETRTTSAERLAERFEIASADVLKLTTSISNPEWRRKVTFVRIYERH